MYRYYYCSLYSFLPTKTNQSFPYVFVQNDEMALCRRFFPFGRRREWKKNCAIYKMTHKMNFQKVPRCVAITTWNFPQMPGIRFIIIAR